MKGRKDKNKSWQTNYFKLLNRLAELSMQIDALRKQLLQLQESLTKGEDQKFIDAILFHLGEPNQRVTIGNIDEYTSFLHEKKNILLEPLADILENKNDFTLLNKLAAHISNLNSATSMKEQLSRLIINKDQNDYTLWRNAVIDLLQAGDPAHDLIDLIMQNDDNKKYILDDADRCADFKKRIYQPSIKNMSLRIIQLHLNEFSKLNGEELAAGKFNKKDYPNCPSIANIANSYNAMSLWVANDILKSGDINQVMFSFNYWINVAYECGFNSQMQDIHGTSAIMGAMSISQVKNVLDVIVEKKLLPQNTRKKLKELRRVFLDDAYNYAAKRTYTNENEDSIPHLGTIQTLITKHLLGKKDSSIIEKIINPAIKFKNKKIIVSNMEKGDIFDMHEVYQPCDDQKYRDMLRDKVSKREGNKRELNDRDTTLEKQLIAISNRSKKERPKTQITDDDEIKKITDTFRKLPRDASIDEIDLRVTGIIKLDDEERKDAEDELKNELEDNWQIVEIKKEKVEGDPFPELEYVGAKESGANRPGEFGGRYKDKHNKNYMVKQDTNKNGVRVGKVIGEFVAGKMLGHLLKLTDLDNSENLVADISLIQAHAGDPQTIDKDGTKTYIKSEYIGGYQGDLWKLAYIEHAYKKNLTKAIKKNKKEDLDANKLLQLHEKAWNDANDSSICKIPTEKPKALLQAVLGALKRDNKITIPSDYILSHLPMLNDFCKMTVARILLADYGVHSGNYGVVKADENSAERLGSIDFGAAFCNLLPTVDLYGRGPETTGTDWHKNHLLEYTKELRTHIQMAEALIEIGQLSTEDIENSVHQVLDKLKSAYGVNPIKGFCERIGMPKDQYEKIAQQDLLILAVKNFLNKQFKTRCESMLNLGYGLLLENLCKKDSPHDTEKYLSKYPGLRKFVENDLDKYNKNNRALSGNKLVITSKELLKNAQSLDPVKEKLHEESDSDKEIAALLKKAKAFHGKIKIINNKLFDNKHTVPLDAGINDQPEDLRNEQKELLMLHARALKKEDLTNTNTIHLRAIRSYLLMENLEKNKPSTIEEVIFKLHEAKGTKEKIMKPLPKRPVKKKVKKNADKKSAQKQEKKHLKKTSDPVVKVKTSELLIRAQHFNEDLKRHYHTLIDSSEDSNNNNDPKDFLPEYLKIREQLTLVPDNDPDKKTIHDLIICEEILDKNKSYPESILKKYIELNLGGEEISMDFSMPKYKKPKHRKPLPKKPHVNAQLLDDANQFKETINKIYKKLPKNDLQKNLSKILKQLGELEDRKQALMKIHGDADPTIRKIHNALVGYNGGDKNNNDNYLTLTVLNSLQKAIDDKNTADREELEKQPKPYTPEELNKVMEELKGQHPNASEGALECAAMMRLLAEKINDTTDKIVERTEKLKEGRLAKDKSPPVKREGTGTLFTNEKKTRKKVEDKVENKKKLKPKNSAD